METCTCTEFECSSGCGNILTRDDCRWTDGEWGDVVKSRQCKACKRVSDQKSYHRHRDTRLAQSSVYRDSNREKVRAKNREYAVSEQGRETAKSNRARPEFKAKRRDEYLQKRYGITLGEYGVMSDAQDGRCAICLDEPGLDRKGRNALHVDHCHATGNVRGLLCSACNTALGTFQDDEDRLIAAAAYLNASVAKGIRGVT